MEDYEIDHRISEDYLKSLKNLLIQLIDEVDDQTGLSLENFQEKIMEMLEDDNHHMLIAVKQGEVVGFINFTVRKTILHQQPSALIDELVVDEKYRGEGLGKKLVYQAINRAKQLGCGEIEVSTEKSNELARKFYQKIGFDEDAVLLEKDL